MHTSTIEIEVPAAENLTVTEDTLSVDLSDGRTISVPLAWYPRLTYASQSEQNNGILHFSVNTFCNYRFDKARKAKPYPWINESEKISVHCKLEVFVHVISKSRRFPVFT